MPANSLLGSYGDITGSAMMFRNKIINGDMRIDQRNAGALVTGGAADYTFPVDRFKIYTTLASKLSAQRVTTAPAGFSYSLELKSLAATTPGTNDEYGLYQIVEGSQIADLGWGTANAKSATLSFWVRSSVTGTYSVSLLPNSANRSYVVTYTINQANTWEYKSIVITPDTVGVYATDSTRGLLIIFDCGSGSGWATTTTESWAELKFRTPSSVSLINTANATLNITGVQFEAGTIASPFEFRPIGTELSLCQRYYQKFNFIGGGLMGFADSATSSLHVWQFTTPLRSSVNVSFTSSPVANFEVRRGGVTASSITALTFDTYKTEHCLRLSTTSTGLTVGQAVQLTSSSSINPVFLAASAEY